MEAVQDGLLPVADFQPVELVHRAISESAAKSRCPINIARRIEDHARDGIGTVAEAAKTVQYRFRPASALPRAKFIDGTISSTPARFRNPIEISRFVKYQRPGIWRLCVSAALERVQHLLGACAPRAGTEGYGCRNNSQSQ